jgi:hypothetical protein
MICAIFCDWKVVSVDQFATVSGKTSLAGPFHAGQFVL